MNAKTTLLTALCVLTVSCAPNAHDTSQNANTPNTNEKTHMTAPAPLIKTVTSPHNYSDTLSRMTSAIEKRPLNLFATIDHAAGASKAGLTLAPSTLFIFGNPKGGSPLMSRNPKIGIALPLKMHVYQEGETVFISYTDITAVADSYGLDPDKLPVPNIVKMLEGLATEVTSN